MRTRRLLAAVLGLALAACGDGAGGSADAAGKAPTPPPAAGTAGVERPAPPLDPGGAWVKGGPLRLDALRGQKAVLVEIGFSSCKRCRATVPNLAKWQEKYGAQGLQVVFVNDGTVSPPLEAVQKFVKELGIQFPVLHDEQGATARAYGVTAYPHVFLVDKKGGIVWDGSPMGKETEVEERIRGVLN